MTNTKTQTCQLYNVKEFFSHLKTSVLKFWNINVVVVRKALFFEYSMMVWGAPTVSFKLQFFVVDILEFLWLFCFGKEKWVRFKHSGFKNQFIPLNVFLVTLQILTQRICNQVEHQKWSSDLMLISAALLMVYN